MIQINKISGRINIDGQRLDHINIKELEQSKREALANYMSACKELELLKGRVKIDWFKVLKWLVIGIIGLIGLDLLAFQGIDLVSFGLVFVTLGIFIYNLKSK